MQMPRHAHVVARVWSCRSRKLAMQNLSRWDIFEQDDFLAWMDWARVENTASVASVRIWVRHNPLRFVRCRSTGWAQDRNAARTWNGEARDDGHLRVRRSFYDVHRLCR